MKKAVLVAILFSLAAHAATAAPTHLQCRQAYPDDEQKFEDCIKGK